MNGIRQTCARFPRPRIWKRIGFFALLSAGLGTAVFASVLLWPMDPRPYLRVNASSEMTDRSGKLMYAFLNPDEQWLFPRELAEISPYLIQATIAAEDQRFYEHAGIDPAAVLRAAWQNLASGGVRSGASTITMQVVKRRHSSTRSIAGKVVQAVQALRLERHATKNEILCAYLNSAPYGLNLVGCEAAARRYFGKPALELTLEEAALLAGLPKAPTALMPLAKPEAARDRRNHVLVRMRDEGFISPLEWKLATAAPVSAKWNDFPAHSPHLAMRLASRSAFTGRVATTLDYAVQARCERAVVDALKTFDNEVTNGAVIVLDAASAEVLARVGSADFFRTPDGGQVDVIRSPRSPGSALKPFTYALAIERNKLYACEMLLDDSLDYGLYHPANYDGKYRGLVSASYALRRSLNVPSVIVLERLGYGELHAFLRQAGLTTLSRPAEQYGLGLTLGNCEVRLDELAAAYGMLANLGLYRPLRETLEAPVAASRRILSEGTAVELFQMLEQPLPDEYQRDVVHAVGYTPPVCWKTGTSTGHHDAWAFVFNRHYVVGVWLGNNSGRSSKRLVGARAALPLAARIFRALPPKPQPAWPDRARATREVRVCAATGLPATAWCGKTNTAMIAGNQYLNRDCDVHYPAASSTTTPETGVVERWPAGAREWDLARVTAPIQPGIDEFPRVEGLQILTPADKSEFVLTREDQADRIRPRASADGTMTVHWYLDGRYLGEAGPERHLFLALSEGEHQLTCMALNGDTDTVTYRVDAPYTPQLFRK